MLSPADPAWAMPYDHHKYIYMAEHPLGSFHIAPTDTRVAVPFLVSILPFSRLTGFQVQAVFFLVCAAVLLYYVLLAAGYDEIEALLGVLMFWSYGAATKLLLAAPYSPDPANFFFLVAALYLLLKDRDVLLALTLALGATVKETIVLVIPLIYTLRASRLFDARLLLRTALIGLPSVAVLLALQQWIPSYNDMESYVSRMGAQLTEVHLGTAHYSFLDALHRVTASRFRDETPVNIVRDLTFGNVGILWLLPFFALARPSRRSWEGSPAASSNLILVVRFLPFLALVYLGWFVALNADRRFAYAFPFWIMLSLNGVRSLAASWRFSPAWFVPLFAFQYILNLAQPVTTVVPADLAIGFFLLTLGVLYSFRSPSASGVE